MKVSIITATYNSAATLSDTLASLEAQTYSNIEYIIIDGASKDGTVELAKSQCSRIAKLVSEPDKGIYDALNKGIALATGDIVGFLHSDDILAYPDAIEDLVSCFCTGSYDAIYADLDYVSKDDMEKVIRHWVSGPFDEKKLAWGWMPPHPTFYMKKEFYEQFGGFNLSYQIAADYDSILRYLKNNSLKVVYNSNVLIKMRVGGTSNNSIKNVMRKIKEEKLIMKDNGLFYPYALIMKRLSKIHQFL
ncbi:PGL/p-HBAD biosynthesis glycosyltransferase [compost metagenome]